MNERMKINENNSVDCLKNEMKIIDVSRGALKVKENIKKQLRMDERTDGDESLEFLTDLSSLIIDLSRLPLLTGTKSRKQELAEIFLGVDCERSFWWYSCFCCV